MQNLVAKDVRYEYRTSVQTVKAVNGVSCTFQQGLVYAIVGASGCGKTTLLSLLAGLDVPTAGSVELDGEATSGMNRDAYRLNHVSVIYQNYNLFYHLTVLGNAAYPLYVRKMPRKEAERIAREKLLQVGLQEDQLKRLPNMLSGGEQQRVAIARALASGTEIVLGDEPTGNLDSENSRNIVDILCRLAHEEDRCVIIHPRPLRCRGRRCVPADEGREAGISKKDTARDRLCPSLCAQRGGAVCHAHRWGDMKKCRSKRKRMLRHGAGGRARTGTLLPAADFESASSTNSNTPAWCECIIIQHGEIIKCDFSILAFLLRKPPVD